MKKRYFLVIIAIAVILNSCVTLIKRSGDDVKINTVPDQAKVTIVGEEDGVVRRERSPFTVRLRHGQDYYVIIDKKGYERVSMKITSSTSLWFAIDLITVIPMIFDIAVDRVTTLDQDSINVRLATTKENETTSKKKKKKK